jgi:GNAT superfamily N-acetyltransferase
MASPTSSGEDSMTLNIRPMHLADLQQAISWAAQEGWNPGLEDGASFFATDPQGFFVGELNGEAISSISAVAYDRTFGFIGFYIVRPEFRGQGFGWQTWQQGLKYLANRNIGLDGVLAQQDNYRQSGFSLAYRNIRFQGTFPSLETPQTDLTNLQQVPFSDLVAFDARFFPVSRPTFLQAWIGQPGSIGLAKLEDGRLAGYGVIRPCQTGWKIGPLFALEGAIAEELLRALVPHARGELCFVDVPEPNGAALQLAQTYHMSPMFETARMYTQQPPECFLQGIFGVTTFELG